MHSSFHIRLAQQSDLAAIVAIYNFTIPSRQVTADLHPVTVTQRQDWFDAHQGERFPLWVVENEQGVCGWMSLSPYYPREAYNISTEISMYIHPDYRHAGLGQLLFDYGMAYARTHDFHNILAVIFTHNEPSCRFFEKNGFQKWGLLPKICRLDDTLADIVIFGHAFDKETHEQR